MSEPRSNWQSRSRVTVMLFVMLVTFVIFYADAYTPLGFAHATLYIAPLMLISTLGNPRLLYIAVILFALLTIAGYVLSPNGVDREIAIANRVASVAGMVAFLIAAVPPRRCADS